MINLFETYNQEAWDLHFSLVCSGYLHQTVVCEDNGWLHLDVQSPYKFYTRYEEEDSIFFNKVPVPDFWEVEGFANKAEIRDSGLIRGYINYAKGSKRRVSDVVWVRENNTTYQHDYYCRSGWLFRTDIVEPNGNIVLKSYFDKNGQEVISEDTATGITILNTTEGIKVFESKVEFFKQYFKDADLDASKLIINSLALPFWVSKGLSNTGDILFWQEDLREIPANMKYFTEQLGGQVVVQHYEEFIKFKELGFNCQYIGFIPNFKPSQNNPREILIATNTDSLENIDALVENIAYNFNIVSVTSMSEKLKAYGNRANVKLYPNISDKDFEDLLSTCGIYLAINYGADILDAPKRAFNHQMLLMGYQEAEPNTRYIPKDAVYGGESKGHLEKVLNSLAKNPVDYKTLRDFEHGMLHLGKVDDYKKLLG